MNMAGGDNDGDDKAAAPYWDGADSQFWTPEAWHKSPEQLQAEARAMNEAAFASAARSAPRHSNPPCPPSHMRLL